jgi:hypothetical protein
VATWAEFERLEPDLAMRGRGVLYASGSGFGFLATTRPDGSPRIHPISVAVGKGGMFITLIPSPKAQDLQRDGRFALHSVPTAAVSDEFAVTGRAIRVDDPGRRADIQEISENTIRDIDVVFELELETALLGLLLPPDYWPPQYSRWRESTGTDHPAAVGYPAPEPQSRDV